jgi:hypothetical protein
MQVTRAELIEVLKKIHAARPLTIETETEPKLLKGNPFVAPVTKTSVTNCFCNFQYLAGIKNRLIREGKDPESFVGGNAWHEPLKVDGKLTPLAINKKNKEQLYLRVMRLKSLLAPEYKDGNGKSLAVADIKPFLPEKSSYSNQGLKAPLEFLVYDINNVKSVKINGETYNIKE